MKKLAAVLVLSVVLSTAHAGDKDDKQSSSLFGMLPADSTYNLITGVGETALGSLWLRHLQQNASKVNAVAASEVANAERTALSRGGSIATGEAHAPRTALRDVHARAKFLEETMKSKSFAGRIKGFRVLGEGAAAILLIVDGSGRVFEWSEAQLEPRWAPEYEFMAKENGIEVTALPQTDAEIKHEVELKERAAIAGSMPSLRNIGEQARKELEAKKKDYEARNATHKAKQIETHIATQKEKISDDNVHTTSEDLMSASLGTVKAVSGLALLKSSLAKVPSATSDLVKKAEESLELAKKAQTRDSHFARMQQGNEVIRGMAEQVSKDTSLLEKLRAEYTDLATKSIQADTSNGVTSGVDLKRMEALKKEISELESLVRNRSVRLTELRAELQTLRNTKGFISAESRARLIAEAEAGLAKARELQVKNAIENSHLNGWRVLKTVGGVVLIADAVGHVYEWQTAKADPSFSPGLTLMQGAFAKASDAAGFSSSPSISGKSTSDTVGGFNSRIK